MGNVGPTPTGETVKFSIVAVAALALASMSQAVHAEPIVTILDGSVEFGRISNEQGSQGVYLVAGEEELRVAASSPSCGETCVWLDSNTTVLGTTYRWEAAAGCSTFDSVEGCLVFTGDRDDRYLVLYCYWYAGESPTDVLVCWAVSIEAAQATGVVAFTEDAERGRRICVWHAEAAGYLGPCTVIVADRSEVHVCVWDTRASPQEDCTGLGAIAGPPICVNTFRQFERAVEIVCVHPPNADR